MCATKYPVVLCYTTAYYSSNDTVIPKLCQHH